MKTLFAITALAAINLTSAQKTTALKDFKSLTAGADMNVTLIKSTENKLVINSSADEAPEVQNENGNLVLNGECKVTVYYKDAIENIVAASDAVIYGKDEIKTASLTIAAASDAKIELTINVQKLNTAANSDATVTLTGKAKEHDAALSTDARFDGKGLLTDTTSIVMSTDASAAINAKDTVNATVSSDGSLKIYGNPKKVNQTKGEDAEIVVVK